MKTKFFTLLFFVVLGFSSQLSGQAYKSAIGLRFGYPTSVSYKTFLNEKAAVEAFAGIRSWGFGSAINVGAAYQLHTPIASVEGLDWYYGAGAGAWLYTYDSGFTNDGSFGIGLSGYLGLQYTFANIPLTLSSDWAPTLFLGGGYYNGFGASYGAFSARYILNRGGK
jgi:hypothetical protein